MLRDPAAIQPLMRSLCVHGLTRRQFQILGACALGYTSEEIAEGLVISRPTVFRHIEILQARIFDTVDIVPSRHLLATWTYAQRDCCARPVWQMIENHQLFENGHQHGFLKSA
jgi:DNA-binding CsgD family transcriptional regulator